MFTAIVVCYTGRLDRTHVGMLQGTPPDVPGLTGQWSKSKRQGRGKTHLNDLLHKKFLLCSKFCHEELCIVSAITYSRLKFQHLIEIHIGSIVCQIAEKSKDRQNEGVCSADS